MKRGVYFILLSVGCNAGAPAADPSAAAPRSKTAKQEAQPLEVRQEYPEDEAFSVYAQRAVRWFNAGEYASLRSQEVILLDNWSGLRESGRLFASAQDLFDWVETSDMGVELRLTEGPYEDGPLVRAGCQPPGRALAIGAAEGDRLVREVEYLSEEERGRARQLGAAVTHFLRDDKAGIGLFFGEVEPNHWELLVVDLIAPPC